MNRGYYSSLLCFITYWPRPSCQNRKCTCVNNRCIIYLITLTVNGLTWVLFVTPTRRRWMSNNYLTRVKTGSQVSWKEHAEMRNMSQRGWAPKLPVKQPSRTGKKRCYGHKSGGQYVAVLFSLQLTSHTVKPLVTLSNPFK